MKFSWKLNLVEVNFLWKENFVDLSAFSCHGSFMLDFQLAFTSHILYLISNKFTYLPACAEHSDEDDDDDDNYYDYDYDYDYNEMEHCVDSDLLILLCNGRNCIRAPSHNETCMQCIHGCNGQ